MRLDLGTGSVRRFPLGLRFRDRRDHRERRFPGWPTCSPNGPWRNRQPRACTFSEMVAAITSPMGRGRRECAG
ncbi:hypothetical protein [Breoghania sp.]|uniref:hypothetical protein n=1 Tax=Breoghania sp. TaxID=2065378 RepID=UPI0026039868|nr:hypothetical protein [Breoghania sp.]MDJ0932234.1 hypothetical protein [Breoghania sp.]